MFPFLREACHRVPLAEAAFRLLDYVLPDEVLSEVFRQHRGRSLERLITFPGLVRLLTDSLLGHRGGSAHQTFQHAIAAETLPATVQAAYGKLRRLPIPLSLGLFEAAAERLHDLPSAPASDPLPASLAEFRVLGFDGKKVKYVVRKLKPLRGLKGNIYGGKLLVVQDLRSRQAVAVEAVADGETADNPLVPDLVDRVRARPQTGRRLWVADRAFCESTTLPKLAADNDAWVVRWTRSFHFHPDSQRPARTGTDDANRAFVEEWGHLGRGDRRLAVRKITVTRPGETPFCIITNLADADRYPAPDLLTLYRFRWSIETMFQKVVQTFDLRHLIGGTPQATIFQAVLCLLLYNITLTIADTVAEVAAIPPQDVSLNLLFDSLQRQMAGWVQMISPEDTVALFAAVPVRGVAQMQKYLRTLLTGVWQAAWRKAPTRRLAPPSLDRAYLCGGHSSVEKILHGRHVEIPLGTPTTDRVPYHKMPKPDV